MSNPKQKAKELFKKYSKGKDEHGWSLCEFDSCAKQCALIVVNEILDYIQEEDNWYWQDVKHEIKKL